MVKKTAEKGGGGMAARASSSEFSENNPRQNFRLGDITWVRHGASSWWPAQVIDEASVSSKPKKKTVHDALVRLYGTCQYLYVDPWKSNMEFKMILKEENKTAMEAFHKVLHKELTHFKSPSDHDEEPVGTKAKTSVKKVRKWSGHGGVKESAATQGSGDGSEHQPLDKGHSSGKASIGDSAEGLRGKTQKKASAGRDKKGPKMASVARKEGTHREIKSMVRDILLGDIVARQNAAGMEYVDEVILGVCDGTERNVTPGTTADTECGRSIKRAGNGVGADSSNVAKRPRKGRAANLETKDCQNSSPSRDSAMEGSEQRSARQIKIMQKLGLVAPSGSPFKGLVAAAHP
uniref:Uncharacterized protein n=1 Tax=Avena sativa TaxID=4498 RepID=A0ACD5Y7D0_AVESA